MAVKPLSPLDLALAALLILGVGICSRIMRLDLERRLAISAVRTVLQLLLIGHILEILFAHASFPFIFLISMVMLTVAGREVVARQHRRIRGWRGWLLGTGCMFVSSFGVAFFALTVVIGNDPWYTPRYAIPLLGMLLGNTMNGIALSLDRMTETLWQQRQVVEQRLALGQSAVEAVREIRQQAMRAGMIPIINSMAVVGLVSLPGMMTGQILGGSPPLEAVKYQILIMFLICAGTGFGVMVALILATRHLFDERDRLRLDNLAKQKG